MSPSVQNIDGNKVRIRVCGLCTNKNGLLMVNHSGLAKGDFWAPPGGGIEFDESASDSLIREFAEETGLSIEVGEFLFVCEFRNNPLHAIELFFEVFDRGGALSKGADPEMGDEKQIIKNVAYLNWERIKEMQPNTLHGVFKNVAEPSEIIDLRGYFKL